MTDSERITLLDARLAKAEARIAELEGRMPLGPIGPSFPPPPSWPWPAPIVTKTGDTSGMPPADWSPSTAKPGDVIRVDAAEPTVTARVPPVLVTKRWTGVV